MNLVAYSDSEDSDNDAPQPPKPAPKPTAKPAVQKVVDRSNPGKIKVSLPSISRPDSGKDAIDNDAPPAKKARTGGGAFSGFNAMLPAPKKPITTNKDGGSSGTSKFGNGFNGGVSFKLKTSSEPAFIREPTDSSATGDIPAARSQTVQSSSPPLQTQPPTTTKPQPAWTARFVPLSVANSRKKKRPVLRQAISQAPKNTEVVANATSVPPKDEIPTPKPKVSLFSIPQGDESAPPDVPSMQYQPLLYGTGDDEGTKVSEETFGAGTDAGAAPADAGGASDVNASSGPQSLADIASSLNLSEAERRQLFGRKRGVDSSGLPATNIVEFNTDAEYAHNEKLRASGETVQHNALRSITGTGKNSLKSLVNVATTQKDALEEHFAQGRRNKREAGNKYGW